MKPNDIANVLITGIGGSRINAVIDNSLRDRVKRVRVSILTFEHPEALLIIDQHLNNALLVASI